jgi:glutamyl-tRNA reductase
MTLRLTCWTFTDSQALLEAAEQNGAACAAECLPLQTCLRNELYVLSDALTPPGAFVCEGADAAHRLFAIVAGAASNIPGEQAVADQVRHALRAAQRSQLAGPRMRRLVRDALDAGAHLRERVCEEARMFELGDLVARFVSSLNRDHSSIALIGRGHVARDVDRALAASSIPIAVRASRRPHRGVMTLEAAQEHLRRCDVVILALAGGRRYSRSDFASDAVVIDLSAPAIVDLADHSLAGVISWASELLRSQADAVARAAHRLPTLASASLARAISPSIADQAGAITRFRDEIVEKEIQRLQPLLTTLSPADAQRIVRAIRHAAARCVHPLHEYVNELGRQSRPEEAMSLIDHLLGTRTGFTESAPPAPQETPHDAPLG